MEGRGFTHLLFADDSFFFFQNDRSCLTNLKRIICGIVLSRVNASILLSLTSTVLLTSLKMSKLPLLILFRLILSSNLVGILALILNLGRRVCDFQDLVDKVQNKLKGWKARLLSQAGRATLISSVLQSLPLYTFSCFKVTDSVCKKLDTIVRSFWWGHEPGTRKLHLVNWGKLCKPKRLGGLGFKNFSFFNQAMIAKQYWRLHDNPNSLLARTFKKKYFPTCSLREYQPKPHHSWVWRNITESKCSSLHHGRWLIGNGSQIPLSHPDWIQCSNYVLREYGLHNGTVADLIDAHSRSWSCDLIRKIYPPPKAKEILQIPIPKS